MLTPILCVPSTPLLIYNFMKYIHIVFILEPPNRPPPAGSIDGSPIPGTTIGSAIAAGGNSTSSSKAVGNTTSAVDRLSERPSMRSYIPGARPAPPPGPKPGLVNNNPMLNTTGTISGSSVSVSGSSVKTMKRPPPPLLAPPAGYLPGSGHISSRGSARGSARGSDSAKDSKIEMNYDTSSKNK